MPYKIGVTSGLYTVARAEELADSIRKLGYALTRGGSVIELAGDVPHEITETDGTEIRHIAEKQGIDITFHGSLTMAMEMPERVEYRDAQDHLQKSIRSAVFAGAKYVNVHASLNIWLELMTYAGRKLTMVFCDHRGRFFADLMKGDDEPTRKLRAWFVQKKGEEFMRDIFTDNYWAQLRYKLNQQVEKMRRQMQANRVSAFLEQRLPKVIHTRAGPISRADYIDEVVGEVLTRGIPPHLINRSLDKPVADIMEEAESESVAKSSEIERKILGEAMDEHLRTGKEWHTPELRTAVGIVDSYHIMAHYLFYSKDPMWVEMAKMYDDVMKRYKLNYDDFWWLDKAWKEAENNNDREFKEFFYAVCAAKFLEGHMLRIEDWISDQLIKKDIAAIKARAKTPSQKADADRLERIAKDIRITIELPDARDPQHAGLFMLWHPKQVYAALKVIRKKMGSSRVWLLADFEHLATQGVDPIREMEKVIKICPDYGSYCYGIHCNAPNPMHAHEPLELGDVRIYQLLWYLRKTGFGKKAPVYVIYERGGGQDPFQHSVDVLRLAVACLEKDIEPDELPDEYFGMKGPVAGDILRQRQIVMDHAWEPLKDLLEMPEEDWTFLSQTAIKKGKRPEQWKKGEFR